MKKTIRTLCVFALGFVIIYLCWALVEGDLIPSHWKDDSRYVFLATIISALLVSIPIGGELFSDK